MYHQQVCKCTMCMLGALIVQKVCGISTIVETDGCDLLYRCWEPNLVPQKKQHVVLTTEPSLLPIL